MAIFDLKGKKVYVEGMGCALSRADAAGLAGILKGAGYTIVEGDDQADLIIINGCTVREASDLKLREKIAKFKAAGKEVVVTGCTAEANPYAVGKATLLPLSKRGEFFAQVGVAEPEIPSLVPPPPGGPVYIMPIGTGCGGNCSYCATKLARGRIASYSSRAIVSTVQRAVERGAVEVDLTAVEINSWGKDTGQKFPDLLRSVSELNGDFMIRVGMINPRSLLDWLDDLLDAFSGEKVFKFFHIPIQSFNDDVLKGMERGYTVSEVSEILRAVRRRYPDASVHTDIIAGFPGETESDFEETVKALKYYSFDKVNVARFSPRPLTKAASMKAQIAEGEKKRRTELLTALWKEEALKINSRYLNRRVACIVVERNASAALGRTVNYKQVVMRDRIEVARRVNGLVQSVTPIDLRIALAKDL
ncbi:MAG: tRNA (N(6)-L-threonylcarbamoyladenosine(37)-C(2))-methylthiotransferase [Thermoprotei archaeon]